MTGDLVALAERVERATRADRQLDAAIAAACRHALPKGGEWALKFPKWEAAPNNSGQVRIIGNVNGNGDYIAGTFRSPAYTVSLDAAMSLVPEGAGRMIEMQQVERTRRSGAWAKVAITRADGFTVGEEGTPPPPRSPSSPPPSEPAHRRAVMVEVSDQERVARIICVSLGDDPNREGDFAEWYGDSPYATAADAILDTLRAGGEVERYRHVKRGTVYEVIGAAELQAATVDLVDGSALVLYRGEDGKLWAREEGEFHDGRFAALAPAAGGE